jgi:hypothetical protein
MRTIVAFLLTSFAAAAQTTADIDRLEKRLADHPTNVGDRQTLLRSLVNSTAVPLEKVRADRREQILWLIEHQSYLQIFDEPFTQLWPRGGRLGDPEGFAQAARLWKEQIAIPGESPKTIANAAVFFNVPDRAQAFAILDAAEKDHPGDPDLARARGILYAFTMVGISGFEDTNAIRYSYSGAMRSSPGAADARREIETSKDPHLIGAAGVVFSRAGAIAIPGDLTFGDDDVPALAERLIRHARELAPGDDEWNTGLGDTLHMKAVRTLDPAEKLRLLNEACTYLPDNARNVMRLEIANAEFAAGDDAATERDARAMVDAPRSANEYNLGQTLLGRLAIARGDVSEAKERLRASLKPPEKFKNPVFDPNMTLAQDVYDAGERDTVLEFLEASRTIWKSDRGRIDRMISFVKKAPSADLVQLSRQLPGNGLLRQAAPAFEATDLNGKTWTREELAGKVVALEFGIAPLAEKVAKDYNARGAILLRSQDDDSRRRFEVLTNPTLVVIDRQGNVSGYRSGSATEAEWRNELESGFGRGTAPATLAAPKQAESKPGAGGKVTLEWEPVDNAESYVVEWDSRDEKGWIFDRDHTVRVIPTRDSSAVLDLAGFMRVRWRVYAVPKTGQPGIISPWSELDGAPVTKIYK